MSVAHLNAGWHSIGDVRSIVRSDEQIVLECDNAQVQITPVAIDAVRIRLVRGGVTAAPASWAILQSEWRLPRHEIVEDSASVRIVLPQLVVKVQKSPCRISFLTSEGVVINADDSSKGMGWDGSEVRVWKAMPENEHYYGFGEKAGPLERRGTAMTDWNSDIPAYTAATDPLYHSIPFFVGLKNGSSYGIFFDNTYRSFFDMGKASGRYYSFGADGGEVDYYFFYGPDPKKVIERYTEFTGRMHLPPKWALGYQQCRWSYSPESKVRFIADNFRKRKIPCDAIYLDIDYMEGYRCFTWSKKNFPDPPKLIGDLAKKGFKLVVIIDPGIKDDTSYSVYRSGLQGRHYVLNPDGTLFTGKVWPGECTFPDFPNTRARIWWGGLYKDLVSAGIKGFWNDMNEPSVFDVPSKTMPLDVRHDVDGRIALHSEIHNVYGMEMARGTYDGLRALQPQERPFVLTRAGYAGIQRYAASWTGDNVSSWEHLAMAIPMCLNFGLSGQPFVGPDIGGFIGNPPGELYTRWLQYGVFLPLCRSHSVIGSKDKEPWAYGPEFERINRESIELRYRFLPFLYTEFYRASETGVPIMRPLMLNYPDDKATYGIDTQFMVGSDLLVSPVVEQGSTSRWMYLPKGAWYDFWTKKKRDGGEWINAEAPLERLPLFVRAGAIIPMQQVVQYVDEAPADPLTFEIYPDTTASGICYEDDGTTYAYRQSVFRLTGVKVEVRRSEIRVVKSAPEGTYIPAKRRLAFAVYGVEAVPSVVRLGGATLKEFRSTAQEGEGFAYDAELHCVTVFVNDSSDQQEIVITR